MYRLVNITLQISDTLATSVSNGPTNNQILLMVSAFILIAGLILWNRLALSRLRSTLTFDDDVKKAWLLLETHEQNFSFTKLVVKAIKSDGDFATEEKIWFDESMQRIH